MKPAGVGGKAQLVRSLGPPACMPLPHDSIATESAETAEDPLRLFPSENQNAAAIPPVPPAPVVDMRDRRLQVLNTGSLVRFLATIVAVSGSAMRVTAAAWASAARRLRASRDGAWLTRIALAISQVRPVISQIAARPPVSAVTIGAFACGIVIGGLAMWLSGASRHITVEPDEVPRAAASPVAPVATPSANPSGVQIADSRTQSPTADDDIGSREFRGSLVVNSRPAGALVFVNGRSVGQTPLVLRNQLAGSRAVRVALDGYEPWSEAVRVVADTETRLSAELKAQRSAEQP